MDVVEMWVMNMATDNHAKVTSKELGAGYTTVVESVK
jgi:hypothetical protein